MQNDLTDAGPAGGSPGPRWYARLPFRSSRSVAWLGIAIAFAVCILVLAGWILNIPLLKSVEPHWIPTRPITLVCLTLAATALALILRNAAGSRRRPVSAAIGAVIILVGLLTAEVYAIRLSTGQESALTAARFLNLFLASGTRMALLTAGILTLIGCVLVLLATGGRRAAGVAHVLMLPAAAASYLVLVSYLLGVQATHALLNVPVAFNTGLALCALSVAAFCVRPETWLLRALTGDRTGSIMARRLLPGLLVLPILIGWLRIYGERTGVFESETGVVLVAVTYAVCFLLLTWLAALSVNRTDEKRRAANSALRESETKHRIVADNTYDFEFWLDPDQRYVYASPSCERITGYKPSEFLADSEMRFKIVHPEDQRVLRQHARDVESMQPGALEYRIIRRDGSVRWMGHVCQPIFDPSGRFLGTRGSNRDITQRKQAESESAADLAALTILQKLSATFVREGDLEPFLGQVVDTAIAIGGADFGNIQLLDPTTGELRIAAHRGFPQWWIDYWNRVAKGQGTCGTALERGERVIVEDVEQSPIFVGTPALEIQRRAGVRAVQSTPLRSRSGKPLGIFSTHYRSPRRPNQRTLAHLDLLANQAADTIERVLAEQTLRASTARLRTILEATQESIWLFSPEGEILAANKTAASRFGLTPADVVGKRFQDFLTPGLSETRFARLTEVVESGRSLEFEDERAGMVFRHSFYPVPDENDRVAAVASFSRDITEQKRTEVRLREQSLMLANANDAIIGYDTGYHVTFWNRSAEQMYGFSEAEAMGRVSTELFHPVYVGTTREEVIARLDTEGHAEAESIRTTRDGRQLSVEAHVIALRDERGRVTSYVSVDRDITERKANEARIVRLAKLYAVLSRVNETIVRTRDAATLYSEVCRIVSDEGGFPLVWVGIVDGKQVKPVACCGTACNYLKEVRIETDGELGMGPTGTAIREDRAVVNDDFNSNPATSPWRQSASSYGFRASASFPLHQNGKAIGAFTLYAAEPRAFDEEQVRLFQALSADVSYALDAIEQERLREQAEQGLREAKESLEVKVKERTAELTAEIEERKLAEQRLTAASQYARSLIEASLDPLVTISADGKITDVNEATIKVTGATRVELVGTDFSEYFTEPEQARAGYRRVFAEGFVTDYPLTIRHRDGHLTDVLYNASVYRAAEGNVTGVFAAARDVTAQKQASQYARSLIEASLDPLVTISADGKITDVNEATVRTTGVPREQLVGDDFSDYFTEPDKAREGYRQVFAKGFVTDYPLTIRHRDGHLTDVLYNASVYRDTRGNIKGVFAAARDVTDRKRAEAAVQAERQRLRDVLNMLPAYVVLLAPDYTVPFANQYFEQRFGKSLGRRCYDYLFHRTEPCENCETYTAMKTNSPHHWEWLGPDGRKYDISDFPFRDVNGSPLVMEVGIDITERKQAEEALQKAHDTLEVKVAERTAELKRSNEELEQFAYVASHDLQEPLRMVASYVGLLGQRYKGRLDEKADKYIAYATGGAKRMHQLVDDLLAFSRVGTRAAPMAPVGLDRVVAEARENLAVAIEQSGAVVKVGLLPTVSGDATQLVQLFQNLFDNAIKFRSSSPPQITISCRDAGDHWEFAVKDNGIGIDPKHAGRIFGLFRRLHTEQEYPGTGIGLAVCKKIVERHGGAICVEPAEGGGSVFRFTLPKQPADVSDPRVPFTDEEEQ